MNISAKRQVNPKKCSIAPEITLPIEFEGIIAVSLPMGAVIRRIMEAAAVDIPVLITGETGTARTHCRRHPQAAPGMATPYSWNTVRWPASHRQ
jgi:DNA-binding NtrC family response regulator